MSGTIYGGKTKNGVIIQDMVDDNRDYIYRNESLDGFFARFAQSTLSEDDAKCETAGPAIAIFSDEEPFNPIWGVRLPGTFTDYTDGWRMFDAFTEQLNKLWEDFKSRQKLEYMESRIKKYNKLRAKADDLQHEIEQFLNNEFGIYTLSSNDTYGMDGNCPMYEWGTELFDIKQIKDIITFKEEYRNKHGEDPDNKEISNYFTKRRDINENN